MKHKIYDWQRGYDRQGATAELTSMLQFCSIEYMIGKGDTTDTELRLMASRFHIPLRFVGFRNELPEPRPGAYIINMQSSADGSGSHWICMYLSQKPNRAFFFDSFGGHPPQEVERAMKRWATEANIYTNPFDIQDINSAYCGQYCLDFLKNIMYNPTPAGFKHFLNKYQTNLRLQQKKDSNI